MSNQYRQVYNTDNLFKQAESLLEETSKKVSTLCPNAVKSENTSLYFDSDSEPESNESKNVRKRADSRISSELRTHLSKIYSEKKSITSSEAQEIADSFGCKKSQVINWFSRERIKRNEAVSKPERILHLDHIKNDLNKMYAEKNYITLSEAREFAESHTGCNERQILNWFARERTKHNVKSDRISGIKIHSDKLESLYKENKYISREKANEVADELSCKPSQIYSWFAQQRFIRDETEKSIGRYSHYYDKNILNQEPIKTLLVNMYERKNYITRPEARTFAKQHGCNEQQVLSWFSHERDVRKEKSDCVRTKMKTHHDKLEALYKADKYITSEKAHELAGELGCAPQQILNWFSQQRFKRNETDKKLGRNAEQDQNKKILEESYKKSIRPYRKELERLISVTGYDKNKIVQWFHRKRYKTYCTIPNLNLSLDKVLVLEEEFEKCPEFGPKRLRLLAQSLKISEIEVANWCIGRVIL